MDVFKFVKFYWLDLRHYRLYLDIQLIRLQLEAHQQHLWLKLDKDANICSKPNFCREEEQSPCQECSWIVSSGIDGVLGSDAAWGQDKEYSKKCSKKYPDKYLIKQIKDITMTQVSFFELFFVGLPSPVFGRISNARWDWFFTLVLKYSFDFLESQISLLVFVGASFVFKLKLPGAGNICNNWLTFEFHAQKCRQIIVNGHSYQWQVDTYHAH